MSDARVYSPHARGIPCVHPRYRSRICISVISKQRLSFVSRVRGNVRRCARSPLRTLILYVLRATWLILQKYFPGILEFDRGNSCGSQPECQRRPRREPLPTPCGWSISTLFRNFRSSQTARWPVARYATPGLSSGKRIETHVAEFVRRSRETMDKKLRSAVRAIEMASLSRTQLRL